MLWLDKKQQNSVKQLSFNKKLKKILSEKEGRKEGMEGGRKRKWPIHSWRCIIYHFYIRYGVNLCLDSKTHWVSKMFCFILHLWYAITLPTVGRGSAFEYDKLLLLFYCFHLLMYFLNYRHKKKKRKSKLFKKTKIQKDFFFLGPKGIISLFQYYTVLLSSAPCWYRVFWLVWLLFCLLSFIILSSITLHLLLSSHQYCQYW